MAERHDSDREVLTSLPRSRPVRRSAKRGDRPNPDNGAAAHPRRATADARGAKATTAGAAKATTAGAAKAASGRVAKRTAGGTKPASARAAKPKPKPKAAQRPRVAPQRKVPPAGYAAPASRPRDPASSSAAELISTTIQAAGELAQIGMTVGRQTLQSMLDRLPKP